MSVVILWNWSSKCNAPKIQREKDPVIILSRPPPPPYVVPYLAETPVSVVSQGKRPIWVNTDFFLGSTCVALEFKILIQQPRHVCTYVGRSFLPGMTIYDGKGVSSILLLLCRCVQTWGKKYKFPPSTAQFPQKKAANTAERVFSKMNEPAIDHLASVIVECV